MGNSVSLSNIVCCRRRLHFKADDGAALGTQLPSNQPSSRQNPCEPQEVSVTLRNEQDRKKNERTSERGSGPNSKKNLHKAKGKKSRKEVSNLNVQAHQSTPQLELPRHIQQLPNGLARNELIFHNQQTLPSSIFASLGGGDQSLLQSQKQALGTQINEDSYRQNRLGDDQGISSGTDTRPIVPHIQVYNTFVNLFHRSLNHGATLKKKSLSKSPLTLKKLLATSDLHLTQNIQCQEGDNTQSGSRKSQQHFALRKTQESPTSSTSQRASNLQNKKQFEECISSSQDEMSPKVRTPQTGQSKSRSKNRSQAILRAKQIPLRHPETVIQDLDSDFDKFAPKPKKSDQGSIDDLGEFESQSQSACTDLEALHSLHEHMQPRGLLHREKLLNSNNSNSCEIDANLFSPESHYRITTLSHGSIDCPSSQASYNPQNQDPCPQDKQRSACRNREEQQLHYITSYNQVDSKDAFIEARISKLEVVSIRGQIQASIDKLLDLGYPQLEKQLGKKAKKLKSQLLSSSITRDNYLQSITQDTNEAATEPNATKRFINGDTVQIRKLFSSIEGSLTSSSKVLQSKVEQIKLQQQLKQLHQIMIRSSRKHSMLILELDIIETLINQCFKMTKSYNQHSTQWQQQHNYLVTLELMIKILNVLFTSHKTYVQYAVKACKILVHLADLLMWSLTCSKNELTQFLHESVEQYLLQILIKVLSSATSLAESAHTGNIQQSSLVNYFMSSSVLRKLATTLASVTRDDLPTKSVYYLRIMNFFKVVFQADAAIDRQHSPLALYQLTQNKIDSLVSFKLLGIPNLVRELQQAIEVSNQQSLETMAILSLELLNSLLKADLLTSQYLFEALAEDLNDLPRKEQHNNGNSIYQVITHVVTTLKQQERTTSVTLEVSYLEFVTLLTAYNKNVAASMIAQDQELFKTLNASIIQGCWALQKTAILCSLALFTSNYQNCSNLIQNLDHRAQKLIRNFLISAQGTEFFTSPMEPPQLQLEKSEFNISIASSSDQASSQNHMLEFGGASRASLAMSAVSSSSTSQAASEKRHRQLELRELMPDFLISHALKHLDEADIRSGWSGSCCKEFSI